MVWSEGMSEAVPARPKVYSVAIETTAYCNQKCDYCYNEWREDGGQSLDKGDRDKLYERVQKLFDACDLDHVTVTGGEPFARIRRAGEFGDGARFLGEAGVDARADARP